MRRLWVICASLGLSTLISISSTAANDQPLHALIITSPGVYHNYKQQTWILAHRIAEYANVRFDVSMSEPERWKSTDYSDGYDVLIYNFCMADNEDEALIANMRRQTEELGVPALFIHCSMHSFRETDSWWPMFGLQTKEHEPLRALTQIQGEPHLILSGIPEEWILTDDELYINLKFDGQPLLTTLGEDGKAHTTAWLTYQGTTPIFGTTLGHSEETIKNPAFQRLLANALLFVTNSLSDDGTPIPGRAGDSDGMDIFESFSAPPGVKFLGEEGLDCTFRRMALAAGPCYVGCILNPIEWGEDTKICKKGCEADLPKPEDLVEACTVEI